MENDVLQTIVATNRWGAILPELFLGVAAVLILFVDLFLPALRRHLSAISIGALLLAAVLVYPSLDGERTVLFGGLLVQDTLGSWMRLFFIASSVVVVHLAGQFLRRQAWCMSSSTTLF